MVRQPIQYFAAAERSLLQSNTDRASTGASWVAEVQPSVWTFLVSGSSRPCDLSSKFACHLRRRTLVDGRSRSESLAVGPDHGKWKPMFVSVRETNYALTPLNASILGNDETARRRLPVTEGECAFCVKVNNAGYCRVWQYISCCCSELMTQIEVSQDVCQFVKAPIF